jgi:hypothetical protein
MTFLKELTGIDGKDRISGKSLTDDKQDYFIANNIKHMITDSYLVDKMWIAARRNAKNLTGLRLCWTFNDDEKDWAMMFKLIYG